MSAYGQALRLLKDLTKEQYQNYLTLVGLTRGLISSPNSLCIHTGKTITDTPHKVLSGEAERMLREMADPQNPDNPEDIGLDVFFDKLKARLERGIRQGLDPHGYIYPEIVTPPMESIVDSDDRYEYLHGGRRWSDAQLLQLEKIISHESGSKRGA